MKTGMDSLKGGHRVTAPDEREFSTAARQQSNRFGRSGLGRRAFLKNMAFGGAALLPVASAVADHNKKGHEKEHENGHGITDSDAAILRFLAAAEILETDIWLQYTELANQVGPTVEELGSVAVA